MGYDTVLESKLCAIFTCGRNALEAFPAKESTRLQSLQVDVTKQTDVNVQRSKRSAHMAYIVFLIALIRPKLYPEGVSVHNPLSEYELTHNQNICKLINSICLLALIQRIMSVSDMDIIRITKVLLPSLRIYAKSRISPSAVRAYRVHDSSVSRLWQDAPAHASKHAIESIFDSLRVEPSPWEIGINIIEPFYAKTPLTASG
ncbi:hypothetical protein BGX21_008673 [Mortierella sp. AD011]|nr:hypothetical protein BGX20_007500 [Mortierella sp. AD010]KAF9397619.1 hypothetical protein BGX21_008673 [Mortierella sp. AD011]